MSADMKKAAVLAACPPYLRASHTRIADVQRQRKHAPGPGGLQMGNCLGRSRQALDDRPLNHLAHQRPPAAPSMTLRRWLISFDQLGREYATPIGMDESIVKWDELPALIRDPGFMIEEKLLAEIVHACADRMSRKIAGGANQVSI
jgi:hypothetical protein